jgi:uncharacterized membrane protein YphA (DoxX/SURF4 family)
MTYKRSPAVLFARVALAVGFLSAVADRFGLWGPPGATNVAWGDFSRFTAYAEKVNPWATAALVPAIAWGATLAEIALGLLLLVGWRVKWVGLASGVLLLLFALGMTFGTGVKTAFDASVFAAAAVGFLLYAWAEPSRPEFSSGSGQHSKGRTPSRLR